MKLFRYFLISIFTFFTLSIDAQVNLALGKPVTSSSVDNATLHNTNLTDGNFSTVARTGLAQVPPKAEWFLVDLGADYFIQNITLGAVVPDNTRSRRFMIVTFPASLGNLGNNPQTYFAANGNTPKYNRLVYTNPNAASGVGTFGQSAANPNVPV